MLIKNGCVHDAVHEEAYIADILVRNGKIVEIGENLSVDSDEALFDASGLQVFPGLVDAHCHTGLNNDGFDVASSDYNETSDDTGAQMRALDSFNPANRNIRKALEGGVTTICTGPGSGRVLTGTFVAVKTHGTCVDDMVLKDAVAMKCSFGQNVKGPKKKPDTRMGAAALLRQTLYNVKDYIRKKEAAGSDPLKRPKYDIKMEALIPVIKGEMPLKVHAHRADDICTAIRLAREFGVKMTLEHVTDGITVASEMAAAGYPVAVGPSLNSPTKIEVQNKSWETAGVLHRAGLKVSIISDAQVTPNEHLGIYAGLAVKHGMDPFAALQAITITAAEHIGVQDRVGSLEVGKDADIIITDGHVFDSRTNVVAVFVDGEQVVG